MVDVRVYLRSSVGILDEALDLTADLCTALFLHCPMVCLVVTPEFVVFCWFCLCFSINDHNHWSGTSRVAGCLYRCHTALKSKAEKKIWRWTEKKWQGDVDRKGSKA